MHTPGPKEVCTAWILYGDGRLDIITKPYTWDTPRLDIWLNQGNRP